MKKILFLLLICVIKLSAYEYLIYKNENAQEIKSYYYVDENGRFQRKVYYSNGTSAFENIVNNQYFALYAIRNNTSYYVKDKIFKDYYTNDLKFLNDLYTSSISNAFLNYLYNDEYFNNANYIEYDDYELLYNSKGQAVVCNIDGIYKGLYDNNTIKNSGSLYDSKGNLVLYNGEDAPYYRKFFNFDLIESNLFQSAVIVGKFSLAFIITLIVLKSAFSLITKFPHDKAYEK